MKFNEKLRALRASKQYTRAYVAKQVGVSVISVKHHEEGRMPRVKLMEKYAELYGTKITTLFFEEDGKLYP